MNLVTGDWIPVLYNDGTTAQVGLQQGFADAQAITDLAANPPQRIALMRLLVCLTQAALDGPRNSTEWKACKADIPTRVDQYLHEHIDQFDLYGENPFMQVPTLKHTHNAVLDKLDFGLAAGNNAVLFDHAASQRGRPHDDGWTALMLLTYLVYSPGGLIGANEWNGVLTGKTSEHAPCVESSCLHTYIRAANLLDAIHVNLIAKEKIDQVANMTWGRPTWELDRRNRNDADLQAGVTTYLGRLVPLTRAIRLEKGKTTCTLANGLAYPKFPECREPTATVVQRRDGKYGYVPTSLDRHPWRELNAVLSLGAVEGGAWALHNLRHLEGVPAVEIWTGGLAADKGKVLDTAEWAFTVPVSMVGNDGMLLEYQKGVERAESAEKQLYGAVKTYADAMKLEAAPMPKARVLFWSTLDQSYNSLIEAANSSTVSLEVNWHPFVQKAAYDAFAQTCPHTTPRQIQAFAKARQKLTISKGRT